MQDSNTIRVWDLPLRLFHWALALCIIANIVLGRFGDDIDDAMLWHTRIGTLTLALLLFRIMWGFTGSTYARFCQFVRSPKVIFQYLKTQKHDQPGHNPLGAVSVLALLASCLFQGVCGLFITDEILTEGPLFHLIEEDLAGRLASLHELNSNVLIVLIGLHLSAIAYYRIFKREKLVKAMITGNKSGPEVAGMQSATGGGALCAIVIAAIACGIVWYITNKI